MKQRDRVIAALVVIIVVSISAYVIWQPAPADNIIEETVSEQTQQEKTFEEIRNREEVRRQRELIVEEIYLMEEREKIERKLKDAIEGINLEIDDIESKLESVRAEKLSF